MTKIKFCFTFFFLLCVFHTNAQQSHIDSLKRQLATAKADTVKINMAYQISTAYSNTNLDSMVFYSKQAIHLLHHALEVEKADSNKLQILWEISDMYQYVSNDSMVFYAQQALLLCMKNRSSFPAGTEVRALYILAGSLWWAGNYPDAKETYFKALQIAEPLADTMQIGYIYNGIAMVERNAGNYREAIKYYTKAENLTKNIPDNQVLNSLLVDKGKCYEQLGILDSAYTYVQECLAMLFRRFQGKNVYGGGVHSAMGIIYSKMGKEQLAVEFFRQSFQLNSEVNNIRLLARGYCEFAEHFDRFNQRDSAICYATKGLVIDQQFHLLVQQLQAATLLSKLYKQENKIDSAYKYQQLMIQIRDSIFSNEKINRLQTLDFNEQLRQQELASEKTKSEEERKQNIQYALIAIGIISFIILFLLLSRSFITNTKLIEFFSVMALLIMFEFLNLLLHPYLETVTHHTPLMMLLALVCIAALLIPLHHRMEKWSKEKLVEKNKAIRLAKAKKTIEKLEKKPIQTQEENTNI
jgi:tetratricopeptide (TPR) repeat protein